MRKRHRSVALLPRDADATAVPICSSWGSAFNDHRDLRIASVFILLVGSLLGVLLPMALIRSAPRSRHAKRAFFVCKYFGTGIILGTAFMHLLSPAIDALADPCLDDLLPDYDWGHFICLMSILAMFVLELMAVRFSFSFGHSHGHDGHGHGGHGHSHGSPSPPGKGRQTEADTTDAGTPTANSSATATQTNILLQMDVEKHAGAGGPLLLTDTVSSRLVPSHCSHGSQSRRPSAQLAHTHTDDTLSRPPPHAHAHSHSHTGGLPSSTVNYPPGNEDHLAHGRDHVEGDSHASYSSQVASLLILEFGVVFHSLFIGLSLAGASNVQVLLAVIAFHQFFEGLGLGSRLAVAQWPTNWLASTGYVMAVGYGLTTPLGIAIGLGVNQRLTARPALSQIVNGVFDAVSSGILIYTALVELLAHEFMFNPEMRNARLSVQLSAVLCVAVGVAVMCVLAKWV